MPPIPFLSHRQADVVQIEPRVLALGRAFGEGFEIGLGRRFRALVMVDAHSKECPAIPADVSISGSRIAALLDELGASRRLPAEIVCDNGPEFTGRAMFEWMQRTGVPLRSSSRGNRSRTPSPRALSAACATNV